MEEIRKTEEFEAILAKSQEGPVAILKHSTACPISAAAYQRVRQYLEAKPEGSSRFYLLKVIESRPVSNAVAQRLQIPHQSPQLLMLYKGRSVFDCSHGAITAEAIENALETVDSPK